MNQKFLNKHILNIFSIVEESNKPIDLVIRDYFYQNKCLGSKDRKYIGNTIYEMTRWKSLIDHVNPQDRLNFYQNGFNLEKLRVDQSIPDFAKAGLSSFLFQKFSEHFGVEEAKKLGCILNEEAPTTIRVNPLKISKKELFEILEKKFSIKYCEKAPYGISFSKREPLLALEEYKNGFFEIQDEGSQLICQAVDAKPGYCILDYCAGSGGKSLGFAHKMEGKGQIYLHDIRPHILKEAKLRFRRAGIQNAQFLTSDHPQWKTLHQKCDIVILDVPCSGTGTLRRNPHQKWEINQKMIDDLISTQRSIILEAVKFLKPSGQLIYATCSILPEENEKQAEFITKELGFSLENPPMQLKPEHLKWDGFFCAVFRK